MSRTAASPTDEGVRARSAMVATGHPLAATAALQTLGDGGSAVDAAIVADAVMCVVEPMATSIGGDLLAMLVELDGQARSYNGTGRAPMAMSPELLAGFVGQRIPQRHALSVTTPGVVRGWHDLHARYGRIAWPALFTAAIDAAARGFELAPVAAREWALFDAVLHRDPICAALFCAGKPPRAGERFANPELAATLRAIAEGGPDAFYLGGPAAAAASANQALGGVLDSSDFANHRGEFTQPMSTAFRGLSVLACPPNTHGVAVLDALDRLEPQSLDPDDPQSFVAAVLAMSEAMDRAQRTVADPAGNTVCTVVVDSSGLAVTLMSSLFKRFGSGIAVPGHGFLLQNRGFGFAAPGALNGATAGRRPYHTVVPGAALRDGRFYAGFGVVGGAMQPQGQLQLLLRLAAWRTPLQAAIDAPRWRLESPGQLAIEPGMPDAVSSALRAAGFDEPQGGELGGRSDFGGAQVVMRDADGALLGGSDRRKDGLAIGR